MIDAYFTHKDPVIKVEWISTRSGNFKAGKVYEAQSHSRQVGGEKLYSGFDIKDEDGDYFSLTRKDENKKWKVIS